MGDEDQAITRALIEDVLKNSGAFEDGVTLVDFTLSAGSGKGDNYYLSVLHAVCVKYLDSNEEEQVVNLIIKCAPDDLILQKSIEEMNAFGTEEGAYTQFFPAILQYQEKHRIPNKKPAPAPRYYKTKAAESGLVLVFENLRSDGYVMADKRMGLDLSHAEIVLRELAAFHAVTYAMAQEIEREKNSTLEEVFPFLNDAYFNVDFRKNLEQRYNSSHKMCISVVRNNPQNGPALADKMEVYSTDIYDRVLSVISDRGEFACAGHGDCWVNNIMFKYEKQNDVPTSVKFIDYQLMRYASPTLDLHYFFFSSVRTQVRRKHLEDMLRVYHTALMQNLDRLGVSRPDFTLDKLRTKFEKDWFFGYLTAYNILPFILARPEDVVDLTNNLPEDEELSMKEMEDRMSASLESMKTNDIFQERLIGAMQQLADMGKL